MKQISGNKLLVKALKEEGVEYVFGYPGACTIDISDELYKQDDVTVILPRHEQALVHAADAYARTTGKVGVCLVTSGPGATNLVTGLATANYDSVPLVCFTGQVARHLIGNDAFQEVDIVGITRSITKYGVTVRNREDLGRIIKEAFYIASTGRPGPVLIDMPKDVQEAVFTPDFDMEMDIPGYNPVLPVPADKLEELIPLIENARRPVIYAGGGIISAEASGDLLEFAERSQIPVATTLMGIGAMPETHPLSLRWLGMHGAVFANNAVNEADLVIALGARFDDRVTGAVNMFCPESTIVHIDIDASEINKNKKVAYPIRANVKDALRVLNSALAAKGWERKSSGYTRTPEWFGVIDGWKKQYPFSYEDRKGYIAPQAVVEELYRQTADKDPIICTGVGQHQMFAAQFFKFDKPRRLATSGGLGTMGYGLPASMGACLAYPDRLVVNIDGDGSMLMNIQELATIHVERLPVKCIILNNQHLGMVVQWEDLKYDSNRAQTFLADPHDNYDPTHKTEDVIYPNYPLICAGFGVKCERVLRIEELPAAITRMIESPEAYVLDVMVPHDVHVLPMILGGMSYKDVILERIAGDGSAKKASELGKEIPTAL